MTAAPTVELPLFPLRSVLYPGGLLHLRVFEARYLDLVGRCLRGGTGFGVVCLRQGGEVRSQDGLPVQLEAQGVTTRLDDVDAAQAGILKVRCQGLHRFAIERAWQQDDGLWLADASMLPDDEPTTPPPALQPTAQALANAIVALKQQQDTLPFAEPHRLDDAGWVANRWCELLPISLAAKQKLMELDDPVVRLRLVDEFLRKRGVVKA